MNTSLSIGLAFAEHFGNFGEAEAFADAEASDAFIQAHTSLAYSSSTS